MTSRPVAPDLRSALPRRSAKECNQEQGHRSQDAWPVGLEGEFDMPACLAAVRRGNQEAARSLMAQLYPLVLKVVRSHLPRRTSEEDLVQTIFMKVFANLGQYQGLVPVEHWVSRIAVNTCLNELKAEKVRPECRYSDLTEEQQHVVEALAASEESLSPAVGLAARELLDKLMAGLNAQDRMVIRLLHLEEKTVAEIRQLTGWSIPVVKVRAFRARRKLQKLLQQLGKEEDL
jgi:RNA polymerase sigma-70 factor (ECF subfamily)